MEPAQLGVASASLLALVVIGWATVQTERRSAVEAATARLIRQLQEVYGYLLETREIWDKPVAAPTVISGQPITSAAGLADKQAWEAYLAARDRVERSLEVSLKAVPNCEERLPLTWGYLYDPAPEPQRSQLEKAIDETYTAIIVESETPARLRWPWSKK
jgi:hypothetical protein